MISSILKFCLGTPIPDFVKEQDPPKQEEQYRIRQEGGNEFYIDISFDGGTTFPGGVSYHAYDNVWEEKSFGTKREALDWIERRIFKTQYFPVELNHEKGKASA